MRTWWTHEAVIGRVAELWRFPVKSALGERLDEVELSGSGVVGDRGWAMIDATDGKVVSAKNPRKWPRVLELRARCLEAPVAESPPPPVEIALPDGTLVGSDEPGVHTWACAGVYGDATSPGTVRVGDPVSLHS